MIFFFQIFQNCSIFSAICVPVPSCELVQILSSFLSILLSSKYLQSNFEVPGPCKSLSIGLIHTVPVRQSKQVLRAHCPNIYTVNTYLKGEIYQELLELLWTVYSEGKLQSCLKVSRSIRFPCPKKAKHLHLL